MSKNRIITLLTDFGLSDVYVGVMKGTIAQINPELKVIDITHQIPSQNIAAARFCLMTAFAYFPAETVHVAVVDPGVGSSRRAIAIKCANCFLVGPDNGLFSGVLNRERALALAKRSEGKPAPTGAAPTKRIAAVELTNSKYWRTPEPSSTFHGRDIFAAAGAHLANGVRLEELGEQIDPASLVQLQIPNCTVTATGIEGCVQYCDRFGNLITNIPTNCITGNNWSVTISNNFDAICIPSGKTYSDSKPGDLIAITGSDGWVEIAVCGGSAQSVLQLELGDKVQIIYR
ncbi:SAM-dependent chlorinase/fluorinase [Microcoleus sp. LEGE 07076]|uniref:SAM hydrolase/SAM-dependent halogenase family protein n=1 Tax=Microcoleus sp. LEGE 07076 TaxID=915322 RepID=UPI0018808A3A|nr:SAM-dependent chlorinase/fluorinase [Microcoleus sp. LEGE 07076]MBE9183253.1 SAM-dependent chlorinase/fluorinase [Microcoleus sp. LEGE 07076]